MKKNKETIDIKECLLRALKIYDKTYNFYTISKKNINKRKKLKLLRLLNLFPNISQVMKNYNTIQDISYDDYINKLFKKDINTQNSDIDKQNIEFFLKDFKNIYDIFFNDETKQSESYSTSQNVNETKLPQQLSNNEESSSQIGGAVLDNNLTNLKDNLKVIIGGICENNTLDTEGITNIFSSKKEINLYELITGKEIDPIYYEDFKLFCREKGILSEWSDSDFENFLKDTDNRKRLFSEYNLNSQLSTILKILFPAGQTWGNYFTPQNSLIRLTKFLRFFSEYEEIFIPIVNNIVKLHREGVDNPIILLIETIKSFVYSLMELKNTIADTIDSVKFIANTIGLVVAAIALVTTGYTADGTAATGTHELLGTVNIARILIDMFAPLGVFFGLTVLKQDQLAAETLISNYPLCLELPINIAYAVITIVSQFVNMKNLCMFLKINTDDTSSLDTLEEIYSNLKINRQINLDKYALSQMNIVTFFTNKLYNSIICQLIESLTLEGAIIFLNINIVQVIINLHMGIVNLIDNTKSGINKGIDIYNSPLILNIGRLLFGMNYTDSVVKKFSSYQENKENLKKIINSGYTELSENVQQNFNKVKDGIQQLDTIRTEPSDVEMGGIVGTFMKKKQ